jgi:general L-amino acid transport system permease protein
MPKQLDWSLRSRAVRGVLYQIAAFVLLALLVWFLASNTIDNMQARGIRSGFDFLSQPAGFEIGESVFNFDASQSYGRAFLVGLTNTLRVATVGIVLTTLLGILIGVGRLSHNFLIRKLCEVYVEIFRNIPVLVQLLMWYFVLTALLPPVTEALRPAPSVFLSQSGLQFPTPVWGLGHLYATIGLIVGLAAAWWVRRAAIRHREQTGRTRNVWWPMLGLIIAAPLIGWLAGGAPTAMDVPELGTFNISGGGALTPEYMTVVIGLTLYTAAFLAEIVRGGIVSVAAGQTEAGAALGLSRSQLLRLVLLPQALRVVVPPTTSQYLNLTKNSSLAVAVGYPDLVSISNTTLNQTGRAMECIVIIMAVYLTLSLITAALMNWYNRKAAIKER